MKVGDKVRHKTGGPLMIIENITPPGDTAWCSWFIRNQAKRQQFALAALEPASEDTGIPVFGNSFD